MLLCTLRILFKSIISQFAGVMYQQTYLLFLYIYVLE